MDLNIFVLNIYFSFPHKNETILLVLLHELFHTLLYYFLPEIFINLSLKRNFVHKPVF